MDRFSVYRNPSGTGLILNVQADSMGHFNTRMAIPLLPRYEAPDPAKTLNPVFDIEGGQYVMVTQFMAAVPSKILKNPICSLSEHQDKIVAAIDLLLQGF